MENAQRKLEHKLIRREDLRTQQLCTHDDAKIVFTNGCFDILHAGHVLYLQRARDLGDCLVVGINDDRAVRKLKGEGRPITKLDDRLTVVASLECVDYVFAIHAVDVAKAIRDLKPSVWAKGGDYTMSTLKIKEREAAEAVGARIALLEGIPATSTSLIIRAIQGLH